MSETHSVAGGDFTPAATPAQLHAGDATDFQSDAPLQVTAEYQTEPQRSIVLDNTY